MCRGGSARSSLSACLQASLTSDSEGRFGFKASDTYSRLYVTGGLSSKPYVLAAHEALDAGTATHAQAVADAQAAADSAAASATQAIQR